MISNHSCPNQAVALRTRLNERYRDFATTILRAQPAFLGDARYNPTGRHLRDLEGQKRND